jgi:hypothetical protein
MLDLGGEREGVAWLVLMPGKCCAFSGNNLWNSSKGKLMRPGRRRRLDTASRAAVLFRDDQYYQAIKALFGSALIGYWQLKENPAGKDYLTFNGSTTTVNCGSGASLDNLHDNAFTAEAWIKAVGPGESGGARLFSKGDSAGHGWALWIASGLPTGRIQCATTDAFSASNLASLVDTRSPRRHDIRRRRRPKIYIAVDGICRLTANGWGGCSCG